MKIAVVASGHIPSDFAHSINTVKHADAFAKHGHNVEILTIERYQEKLFKKKLKDVYAWYGIDNVPIKYFKDKSIFYFKETKIKKIFNTLNKIFENQIRVLFDPEKIISEYVKNNRFDLCYARSYRVVKYNIRNEIPTIMETHNANPKKTKDLINILSLTHSKYFKGIVTIHEKLKENFVELGVPSNKVIVLEDAVNIEKFDLVADDTSVNRKALNLPLNMNIVMYCGSLRSGKGINIILHTAKKLEGEKDIIFYIVGGRQDDIIKWKNYKNDNYPNVVIEGFVEGAKVPLYLKSADILFMPYDITEKNMIMDVNTTSPLKLFEYMGAKKPIVATKIEVIEKIISNNESGILVDNNSYDKAIKKIISDRELANTLSDNAFKKAQIFTYKKRCEKILNDLYYE